MSEHFKSVDALIKARRWTAGNGSALDSSDNYMGEDLSCWISVIGHSRDSTLLEESNFDAALEQLGGEGRSVQVHRFGHWGCGWYELIQVRVGARKKLEIAREILNSLADYPVLDEQDYSEREYEATVEWIESEGDLTRAQAEQVFSWLWEHKQDEVESVDDTGGCPSREVISEAVEALGMAEVQS